MTEEQQMLAAELALGVLEGDALAQALRLQLADPEFAQAVDRWSVLLAPLANQSVEVDAPDIWSAVEARLDRDDAANGASNVQALSKVRFWRRSAIGSAVVAAGLAIMLVVKPAPAPVDSSIQSIAQLQGDSAEGPKLAALYDAKPGRLSIRAVDMPSSTLAPELWVIPSGGAPVSLGMVARQGMTRIQLSEKQRRLIRDGATLAITLEPLEGAPHKAPSSAPVAAGTVMAL